MLKKLYRKIPEKYTVRIDDYRRFSAMFFRDRERLKNEWKDRQKKTSFGKDFSDKTFFVIRRNAHDEGLFSTLNYVLGGIHRAELLNCIPVVDMKNCYSAVLQTKETRGKENAWEYFFEQPGGYSVDDIAHCRKVILSDKNSVGDLPDFYYSIEDMNLNLWSALYQKYIKYSDGVIERLRMIEKETSFVNKRVLGITIRRGIEWGYLVGAENYMTYPLQLDLNGYIDLIRQKMKQWKCDHVFVSIDDKEGAEILKKELGNSLIILDRVRRKYFENGVPLKNQEKRQSDAKYDGLSQKEKNDRETLYLIETIMLSRCNSVIATKTSANVVALMMNGGKYEHLYQI